MDMETARDFELHNRSYDWKRNTRRAQALHEQGYTWDYDSSSYIVFCNRMMLEQSTSTGDDGILDNFLSCLRMAENHYWSTQ